MNSYNITFPFNDDVTSNRLFQMNRVTKDAYLSNLLLLLLTEKNERYYQPDYGTFLLEHVFEPNDEITADMVEEDIKETVALFMPEIKIVSVRFNWLNTDNGEPIPENQLNVNVKFVYREGSLSEEGNLDLNF
jgi:phage baseplate assembly protein W